MWMFIVCYCVDMFYLVLSFFGVCFECFFEFFVVGCVGELWEGFG